MQNVESFSISPKSMLGKMFQDLCNLSAKTRALEINNSKEKSLSNFIRKIYVSWMSYDKYLVAIAGLQGVGKTTFLRNYLNLDSIWLKDNPGRGERYPVLVIQEPGLNEPEGIIRRLVLKNGLYELQEKKVSPEEFSKTIQSEFDDGDGSSLTLLPVLKIPKATPYHQIGFLLLPGYETKQEDWQDLMCHSLLSANLPVIVTDSQALASDGTKAIREDLKKNFLKGVEAIVVYSKIDERVKKPEQAFQTVQSILGIQKESHLVFTGTGSPEFIQSWRVSVNQAIGDSYVEQSLWRQKQLSALKTLISEEMRLLLSDLDTEIAQIAIYDETDSFLGKMSNEYSKAVGKLRKELEKNLDKAIAVRVKDSKEIAKDQFRKEISNGKFNEIGRKIRDWWYDDDRAEKALNDILNNSWNETFDSFSNRYLNAVSNITFSRLEINNAAITDDDQANPQAWGAYLTRKRNSSTELPCAIKEEILTNIRILFKELDKDRSIEEDACFLTTIKLLPVLSLELSRLSTLDTYHKYKQSASVTAPKSGTSIPDSFLKNTESGKKILHAIGYMLFIDVSADGQVDTIPALWNLITGAEGATLNPYVLAAVAVFAIGTLGITLGDELNREHGRCRASLCAGIDSLGAALKTDIMSSFDDMMEKLWETIENRFHERHHQGFKPGYTESAKHLISTIKHDTVSFLTNIDLFLNTPPVS